MRGELRDKVGYVIECEFRLSLDIFNDDIWIGEYIAGLIDVIRRWRSQPCRLRYLQKLEFIGCDLRVLLEVDRAMPAYNHLLRLAVRSLNLQRRHLR